MALLDHDGQVDRSEDSGRLVPHIADRMSEGLAVAAGQFSLVGTTFPPQNQPGVPRRGDLTCCRRTSKRLKNNRTVHRASAV